MAYQAHQTKRLKGSGMEAIIFYSAINYYTVAQVSYKQIYVAHITLSSNKSQKALLLQLYNNRVCAISTTTKIHGLHHR